MSKLKQLIALQASDLSVRAMARALGLSVGAVSKYLRAVRAAGVDPDEAETLPENEFEQRVFGPAPPCKPPKLVPPDYPWVHTELKRQRHVKLLLPAVQSLYFEERIAMLIDRERLYRDNQSRTRPLRGARLKVAQASIVDINYKAARELDKRQIAQLASGKWIRRTQNLLITGATGSGKTWIACALAQQTCRQGHSVLYWRMPRCRWTPDIPTSENPPWPTRSSIVWCTRATASI